MKLRNIETKHTRYRNSTKNNDKRKKARKKKMDKFTPEGRTEL